MRDVIGNEISVTPTAVMSLKGARDVTMRRNEASVQKMKIMQGKRFGKREEMGTISSKHFWLKEASMGKKLFCGPKKGT